ncbi:hypothetical protein C8Q79DRAFT_751370 [Trametes meyenii]|nr:hypothetical protein C8Q79DRAFT_751370 [Trametes meyenii]
MAPRAPLPPRLQALTASTSSLPRLQATTYEYGDICRIYETPTNAFYRILLDSQAIKNDPIVFKQCQDALDMITARGSNIGKDRPCILACRMFGNSRQRPTIYVMCTFGGASYVQLSEMLRIFSVPVSPNLGQPGMVQILTEPKWPYGCKQWVVAYPFQSTRRLKSFWCPPVCEGELKSGQTYQTRYKVKESEMTLLREQSKLRVAEWEAKSANDPNFAVRCAQELQDKKWQLASVGSVMTCGSTEYFSRPGTPLEPLPEEDADVQPLSGDVQNLPSFVERMKQRGPSISLRRKKEPSKLKASHTASR